MITRRLSFYIALEILALFYFDTRFATAYAQGTAFTYQGQLQVNGTPASGVFNLTFSLFTNNAGGVPVAGPVTNNGIVVSNGLFTVAMDFGSSPFVGATNSLEIGVEPSGGNTFTILTPRQPLSPTPYSIYAENVNSATLTNLNVSTATGILPLVSLPSPVVTNGASGVSLGSLTATNYGYVGKWITNAYNIATNDTLLFCWGTNELLTLPATAPMGKMFTIFSKNPSGSVILTNGNGTQVITIPGLGQSLSVNLGSSTSPSNIITVTFDGSNY